MNCKSDTNKKNCNCTYTCNKKGICCDCLTYHRKMGELPACYFPPDFEKTYDRSVESFIALYQKRGSWL